MSDAGIAGVPGDGEQAPTVASPFLKWAGGKTQLLAAIMRLLPREFLDGRRKRYVEPMVGGGAVLFAVAQQMPLERIVICDCNEELILAYRTVQRAAPELVQCLREIEVGYHGLDEESRQKFFYDVRARFNLRKPRVNFATFNEEWIRRSADIIFLNKTCFNGLFRMNANGLFNVPFGRYTNPTICAAENLLAVARVLSRAEIRYGDYSSCADCIDASSFAYFDPPYRPLSSTSRFTAYSRGGFDDEAQARLAAFFREMDAKGALLMLSNSDPKNADENDTFFDDLYAGFSLSRVPANRMINSKAESRGAISELLITNYGER